MKTEMTIHGHRIDHQRADKVIIGIAAAIHFYVGIGRDEDADKLAVPVKSGAGDAGGAIQHQAAGPTTFIYNSVAANCNAAATRKEAEAGTCRDGDLVVAAHLEATRHDEAGSARNQRGPGKIAGIIVSS